MLICFSKEIIRGTADVIESQSLDHPLSFSKFHRSSDRQIDDLSGEYGRNNYLCTSQDHVGGTNLFNPSRNAIRFWFPISVSAHSCSDCHVAFSIMRTFPPWVREMSNGCWIYLPRHLSKLQYISIYVFWDWGNNNGMGSGNHWACREIEPSQNSEDHLTSLSPCFDSGPQWHFESPGISISSEPIFHNPLKIWLSPLPNAQSPW